MTRKEMLRQEFEEHFYATWPDYVKSMSDQQLINFNEERCKEINSSYPETLVCLKHWVLQELSNRGL